MMNAETSSIDSPEPFFYPLSGYALRIGRSDRAMLNYLAACIEEKSENLLLHTRRILIAIDLKDPDEIFGALIDLFIAKGESASNVRANLLQRAEIFLSAGQKDYLIKHLATGLDARAPVVAPRSRLTAGLMADVTLS